MSTLIDLISEGNPAKKREQLLRNIEDEVKKQAIWGSDFCVMTIATNIYTYASLPATYLDYRIMGYIEEHLVKFRQEGCKGILILLSTYGGEITFPEALLSKIKNMGFEKVHTFILDTAFSAGTLLGLLSDKIIGFSNSHLGPVDPQIIVSTPQGVSRVISAMSVKRLIESVLLKIANDQKLGTDGLVRLYVAQDLLYAKALESIIYIDNLFSNNICKNINRCEELKKLLLHEVTEHAQPISLQQLANMIPEKIVLIDDNIFPFQQLRNLIISYRSLLRHLFTLETGPNIIKAFVIGSKYGEGLDKLLF
ncbi:MAG: hypothetical protein RQ952_08045 [Thermoproteota archaeon]|nr:hypothetical protein [Thermoproteota archaeon]